MADLHSIYNQYITKAFTDLTFDILPKPFGPFIRNDETLVVDLLKTETEVKYVSEYFNYYIRVFIWPNSNIGIRIGFIDKKTESDIVGRNTGCNNINTTFEFLCLVMNNRILSNGNRY